MNKPKNSSAIREVDECDNKCKKLKKWGPKSLEALQELIDKGIIPQNNNICCIQTWLGEDEFLQMCHKLKRNRYKTINSELINKTDLNNSGMKVVESIDKTSLPSDIIEVDTNTETADYEKEKDPELQKEQHTGAHVKRIDHDTIETYKTTKQTRYDDQLKKVDCVTNSQDNEDGQDEQSDDEEEEDERDDAESEGHSNAEPDGIVPEAAAIQPGLHQAAGRDHDVSYNEDQPQVVAPTECTSPSDDKPVKVTFVLTVPNRESNEADSVTEPTDCTSPPDGDLIKPTFVVTVRSTSEKTQLPHEFPMELPGTKHSIPEQVISMVVQEDIPKQQEETDVADTLVTGQLLYPLTDDSEMNNDGIGETSELHSGDGGYCDGSGAASQTSQYSTFNCGPAEVADSNDEYDDDDDDDGN